MTSRGGADQGNTHASASAEAGGEREPILAALTRWTPGAERRFLRQGPWLVRRDLLPDLARGPFARHRIPGLAASHVPRLAAGMVAGRGADLRVAGDALQIAESGGRVRTFDLSTGTSSKLVLRNSRYGSGTQRELHVRQAVLPGTGVRFPPVQESASDDTHLFLVEGLVDGRRFAPRRDRRLIGSGLVDPLIQLAEARDVRRAPLSDALGAEVARAVAEDARSDPILTRARAIVAANPMVTTVFGHGDLLPSNIAVARDGLILLDWETAGELLVGYDLLRLWLKYPKVDELIGGARKMVSRFQTGGVSFSDTVCLRLAQVLAGTDRVVHPAARRRWPAMA